MSQTNPEPVKFQRTLLMGAGAKARADDEFVIRIIGNEGQLLEGRATMHPVEHYALTHLVNRLSVKEIEIVQVPEPTPPEPADPEPDPAPGERAPRKTNEGRETTTGKK